MSRGRKRDMRRGRKRKMRMGRRGEWMQGGIRGGARRKSKGR